MRSRQHTISLLVVIAVSIGLLGCSEKQSPTDVRVHPVGWNDVNAETFHGDKTLAKGGIESCMECHGTTLNDGGESSVACTDCHNETGTEDFRDHLTGAFERLEPLDWKVETCSYCHGADYSGGLADFDCTTCHQREEGPEACNTCHGNFEKTFQPDQALTNADIAPPRDLHNASSSQATGVGQHSLHMEAGLDCAGCHPVVNNVNTPGHLDGDGVSELRSDRIPTWNRETGTCTAICHVVDGSAVEKDWTP